MTTARALFNNRRRREALVGDCFVSRLLRMNRNRTAQRPALILFRKKPSRLAA
mgnify:CR=1 FL=1